jgi:5-methylcytosine-specific restriction protein A
MKNEFEHSIGDSWGKNFLSNQYDNCFIVEARSHYAPRDKKDVQVAFTFNQVSGMLKKLEHLKPNQKFVVIVRTFKDDMGAFDFSYCYLVVVPKIVLEQYSESKSNMYFTKKGKRGEEAWKNLSNGLVKYYPINDYLQKKVVKQPNFDDVENKDIILRNPPWNREKLILALDLYFKHHPNTINKNHVEVLNLSNVLNLLTKQTDKIDVNRFRNPNEVYMKLCDFLRFDHTYKGKGSSEGSKIEEEIWNEFVQDRVKLVKNADNIRLNIDVQSFVEEVKSNPPLKTLKEFKYERDIRGEREIENSLYEMSDENFIEYINRLDSNAEIHIKEGLIKIREYNKRIIKDLKERCNYSCQICGYVSVKEYGESIVEAHHIEEFSITQNNKPENILIVCPNHHRLIHKAKGKFDKERLQVTYSNGRVEVLQIKSHFSLCK